MTTRLQKQYQTVIVPHLMQELGLKNPMQVPKIEKITINMGVGEAVADKKLIDNAVGDLVKITGQKPLLCKSRKSIASFKLREGLLVVASPGGIPAEGALRFAQLIAKFVQALRDG